jgi:hypothetical protein
MANDFIKITATSRPQMGNQVIRLANLLREVRDLTDALNDAAGRMHDGATYTTVESNFGLPGGTGANFVTLLGYVQEILNTSTAVSDANRLARLDEFVSRLAGQ